MSSHARVRVNLNQREFEVEGSEEFVQSYFDRLEGLVDRTDGGSLSLLPEPEPSAGDGRNDLGSYGEFLQKMPNSSTEVDRVLATGFYLQQASGDSTFNTADTNRSLAEHGIRIGNPSQCVRQSLSARRVFLVTRGRYRVSQQGRQYLRQLMGPVIPENG